ncbi:MAG: hypothetical protein AAB851_02335 [Patescibacteria group bacterium]
MKALIILLAALLALTFAVSVEAKNGERKKSFLRCSLFLKRLRTSLITITVIIIMTITVIIEDTAMDIATAVADGLLFIGMKKITMAECI